MENISNVSSEEELLRLRNQGKISEAEYNDLLGAMKKPSLRIEPSKDEPPCTSRLSRPAVWGAILAPFFYAMIVLTFTAHSVELVEGQQPPGPQWWQYLLIFTVLPIGVAAPFATTILGMISISQIRHSAGKLHGLGLAVADTLLFPLLALLGICYWFVTLMDKICVEAKIYGSDKPLPVVKTIIAFLKV
jgi:uncharacterized integral membrane protein